MTNKIKNMLKLPAEWESSGAILLSWPHKDTDWNYMLCEVTSCFIRIAEEIIKEEYLIIVAPDISIPQTQLSHLPQERIKYVPVSTDDTWARDFGVITTTCDDKWILNDFKFNGWGLKFRSCNDNLITQNLIQSNVLKGEYNNELGFVLEGGSIESNGQGLLLTTSECLLSPNRNGNLKKEQIENYLSNVLGAKKILWLDYGALEGDDTDSHIDTLARIAPNNTIVYVGCDDINDSHYESLMKMKQQLQGFTNINEEPFNLIELPLPSPIYDEDGLRLPATYANFLILKESILMPTYNQPQKDLLASQILKIAFPEYKIKQIDCNALIKQHGSLHCVTMQLPNEILNL